MNSQSEFRETGALHCPACGSTDVSSEWVQHEFPYGAGGEEVQLRAYLPVRTCHTCGLEYLDEVGEALRHDAVCEHLGILKPAEVVAIREKYNMTQQEFSLMSRIGRASLARWEVGSTTQNRSIDNLLFLLSFPENIDRLRARNVAQESQTKSAPCRKFRALSPALMQVAERQATSFQLFVTSS